jgi:hypothetical protein
VNQGSAENIRKLQARRAEAWNKAAEKYLYPKPSSVAALAIGLRAWCYLERIDPAWREKETTVPLENSSPEDRRKFWIRNDLWTPEAIQKFLVFKQRKFEALAFEQQYRKAFFDRGEELKRFFRRLQEASEIPDELIYPSTATSRALTLDGRVLLAWKRIMFEHAGNRIKDGASLDPERHKTPTKKEIRSLVERDLEKEKLPPITVRHWARVWKHPLIAVLMDCP